MGKSIKGHMTRVDRLRARGQFVHSVQNNSSIRNTLTLPTIGDDDQGVLTIVLLPAAPPCQPYLPNRPIRELWY